MTEVVSGDPTASAVQAATQAVKARKLSASAPAFQPGSPPLIAIKSPVHTSYAHPPVTATSSHATDKLKSTSPTAHDPTATTTTTPTHSTDFIQPDDAEDEDELQLMVDTLLAEHPSAPDAPPRDVTMLTKALLRQVEYYFSNQNLWVDSFLQGEMKKDPTGSGFIPLTTILSLKKVESLTHDMALLICALKGSEKLVLNQDSTAVKRIHPLQPYDEYRDNNRTIFVDRLPPGSTIKSVKKLFARFGKVIYVLRADHMLGASGMAVEEKGKLTPHASPKIKPRSLSNSDVGISPQLLAQRFAKDLNGTPSQSPSMTGMTGVPISLLSPAQRNRVIAATTAVMDPDAFTAAFIQFEKPTYSKKAISHIVAYNKQLKAQTPKGSPRVSNLGRRGSHGGIPALSASTMGGSGEVGNQSTPPRSRTIKISSQNTTPLGSPKSTPLAGFAIGPMPSAVTQSSPSSSSQPPNSPPRARPSHANDPHLVSPPHHDLPPTHPVSTLSPPPGQPPRHHSPGPSAALISPLSPLERAQVRDRRAMSATSPPPSHLVTGGTMAGATTSSATPPRKVSAASDTPPFGPLSPHLHDHQPPPHHESRDSLPELHLPGVQPHEIGSPYHGSVIGVNPPVVEPLPESFIGMFVMPKISYLKALKTKPGEAKKKDVGLGSPSLTSHATTDKEREKQISPISPIVAPLAPKHSGEKSVTSTPSLHSVLSASAPVFQPSMTPLLVPAPMKPLAVASSSPLIRALKTNWRNDGSTPLLGPSSMSTATAAAVNAAGSSSEYDDMSAFSLSTSGSPSLGPAPSPQFDADGNLLPPKPNKKKKTKNGSKDSSPTELDGPKEPTTSTILMSDRPRFSLTAAPKRNSLGVVQEAARQVVSRFALGPSAPEAIGFGGRGRMIGGGGTPIFAAIGAGGGKPIQG